jgi:transitional endoplasmic reticulum ATPase
LLTPLQILDADMKESIRSDVDRFFSSRDTYANLKVPWKRGIIYYGPPGNGKTISIKATMHTLYERKDPIPTLYVRSLSSFAGPEYSINQIFSLARRTAPCYLVFEDLDTIVSDNVRSYFLNEVDGIKRNDGILMLGSTNHLDRLDPGISKRPSRFDRKYLFPNPDEPQRVQYAHYWQKKLESNEEIEFPDALCEGIASITEGFSFAYIQEAMVASLLAIAARGDKGKAAEFDIEKYRRDAEAAMWREMKKQLKRGKTREDVEADIEQYREDHAADEDLEKLVLWREIKKQVKILRDEMGDEEGKMANAAEGSEEKQSNISKDEAGNGKGKMEVAAHDMLRLTVVLNEIALKQERQMKLAYSRGNITQAMEDEFGVLKKQQAEIADLVDRMTG